jgi:hypothetical protein
MIAKQSLLGAVRTGGFVWIFSNIAVHKLIIKLNKGQKPY